MKNLIYSLSIISLLLSLPLSAMEDQDAVEKRSRPLSITTLNDVEESLKDDPICLSMAKKIKKKVEAYDEDAKWEKGFKIEKQVQDSERIDRVYHAFDGYLQARIGEIFGLKAASGKRCDVEYERLQDEYNYISSVSEQLNNAWSKVWMSALPPSRLQM